MVARRALFAGSGRLSSGLRPGSTITVNRSGSNPTFNFNSLVENMILVGSTYWTVYQTASTTVCLASSSSPDGPWTAYSGNPVATDAGIYAPHLLEDAGTFYIFYAQDPGNGGDGKMYYTTASAVTGPYSPGTLIFSPGTAGAWDSLRVGEPSIIKVGSTYYMAYMGEKTTYQTTERLGMASASSLTGTWTRYAGNPIIIPGPDSWDGYMLGDPEIFYVAPYYWITYAGVPGPSSGDLPWATGLAYASSPESAWTKFDDNPLITASGSGFDFNGAFRGAMYVDDSGYHLTYTGLPSGSVDLATMKGGNATLTLS